MKYIIVCLTILLLILSCNIRSDEIDSYNGIMVIDIENSIGQSRSIALSEIASDIEYIPLEYSEKSIVGKVFQRGTVFENDTLFIMQMNGDIKIFDSTGKFIRTFNRMGRSSQEYSYLNALQITNNNTIIISTLNTCKEYTTKGKHIRSIFPLQDSTTHNISNWDFAVFNNKFAFAPDIILNDNNIYSAIITDSLSNIVLKVKYPIGERQKLKEQDWSMRATCFSVDMIPTEKGLTLFNGINPYILRINNNLSIDTLYFIKYGNSHKVGHICESSNYLFMQLIINNFDNNKNSTNLVNYALFDKSTGLFSFIAPQSKANQGFIDDLLGGPSIWPMYTSRNNFMISIIEASTLKNHIHSNKVSEKLRNLGNTLKENDNPILIKIQLK